MKLISAELIDVASHVMGPKSQTRTLSPPDHEVELQADGWLRWRVSGGDWRLSPPSMVRNVVPFEEVPTKSNAESDFVQESNPVLPSQVQDETLGLPRKRGRPAKSV